MKFEPISKKVKRNMYNKCSCQFIIQNVSINTILNLMLNYP